MPVRHSVDRPNRLIRIIIEGDVDAMEMLDVVNAVAREAGGEGYNVLSDHRLIGEPITRPVGDLLLARLGEIQHVFGGCRWGVAVSKPASYGMMRMLAVLAQPIGISIEPFYDFDTAERWAMTGETPS